MLPQRVPDGDPLPAIIYRPEDGASQGAILIRDRSRASSQRGAMSDSSADAECWGGLPEELCRGGWQIIVPDRVEWDPASGAVIGPELSPAMRAALSDAPTANEAVTAAFDEATETLALICLGAAGRWAPRMAASDPRVTAMVWILPEGEESWMARWELPADRPMRLLLVASEMRQESLALASDLFSRFNRVCELWLLDWGESGCAVLAAARERRALAAWLAAAGKEPGT